jgi:uncharacterized protein YgiM (DUF1202 family)
MGILIGKLSNATLTITSKEGGKQLTIAVQVQGNYGTAEQDQAMKLVSDFKSKLTERIGQSPAVTIEQTPLSQASQGTQPAKPEVASTPAPESAKPGIAPTPNATYLTILKTANIRSSASTKSKIVTTIKKDEKLQKMGESGDWYNVKLPSGATGWISKALAKEIE